MRNSRFDLIRNVADLVGDIGIAGAYSQAKAAGVSDSDFFSLMQEASDSTEGFTPTQYELDEIYRNLRDNQ